MMSSSGLTSPTADTVGFTSPAADFNSSNAESEDYQDILRSTPRYFKKCFGIIKP